MKVSTGMVDEKVTVISSVVRTYQGQVGSWDRISAIFFLTEAGNALAALGNIHEGDSHILKWNGARLIIVTVILFDNSMT